jgi:hypothetical protein
MFARMETAVNPGSNLRQTDQNLHPVKSIENPIGWRSSERTVETFCLQAQRWISNSTMLLSEQRKSAP